MVMFQIEFLPLGLSCWWKWGLDNMALALLGNKSHVSLYENAKGRTKEKKFFRSGYQYQALILKYN